MRLQRSKSAAVVGALAATVMVAGLVVGQTPHQNQSLDKPLLDDLEQELLKGLPSPKPSTFPPSQSPMAEKNRVEESNDPIANLAARMRGVQNRMAKRDTSAMTQNEQRKIVADLDAMLQRANQSRKTAGNPNQAGGTQASTGNGVEAPHSPRDSTSRVERGDAQPTERGDTKDVLRRIWGHLPEKLRDEMQSSFSEQFLPKYERLIEEYYKRLAEERTTAP